MILCFTRVCRFSSYRFVAWYHWLSIKQNFEFFYWLLLVTFLTTLTTFDFQKHWLFFGFCSFSSTLMFPFISLCFDNFDTSFFKKKNIYKFFLVPIFFSKWGTCIRGWMFFLQSNSHFLFTHRGEQDKHHFIALED